jgi:hypothetical protein
MSADLAGKTPRKLNAFELSMLRNSAFPDSMCVPPELGVINSAVVFKKFPSRKTLLDNVSENFGRFVRFRSVLDPESGNVTPHDFNIDNHVVDYRGEKLSPGRKGVLEGLDWSSARRMDMSKPLWEVIVFERAEDPFVVFRCHHSIGDGFSISDAFKLGLRDEAGNPAEILRKAPKDHGHVPLWRKALVPFRAIGKGVSAVAAFFSAASLPHRAYETENAFSPVAPKKAGNVYSGKRVNVMVPDVSLAFVKELKNTANATLNDVILAVFSGAVRRYNLQMEEAQAGSADDVALLRGWASMRRAPVMRALVPFGFPKTTDPNDPDAMDNCIAFLSVPLAVGSSTETDRVAQINKVMGKIKNSMKAVVNLWTVNKLNPCLPKSEQVKLAGGTFARHSVVFSNLPGPHKPVYWGGGEITHIIPCFLNVLPQVILFSYAGKITMTLTVDPEFKGDVFAECYKQQFRELADELGVSSDAAFPVTR